MFVDTWHNLCYCLTSAMMPVFQPGPTFTDGLPFNATEDVNRVCKFPFRLKNILYYGCTQLADGGSPPVSLCATEIDDNYDAVALGGCNDFCHTQRKE